jgi:glucose/arabinose dehydrogenase
MGGFAQPSMVTDELSERLELVSTGLSFPTSIAFDKDGVVHIAESGLPFGGADAQAGGRVLRVLPSGEPKVIADGFRAPVNGLTWHDGAFFVSQAGQPAAITRLERDGATKDILAGLPGPGNYHVNMTVFGADGKLYFSQGSMTNTGMVGLDAYEIGWLRRLPHDHDIPGYDIVLNGVNVETENPLETGGDRISTGAFASFGTRTEAGTRIAGRVPCTAAIMRCNPDGSDLELVAWGVRNAYGLGFMPDGRLLAVDQGVDDRGSRPIGDAPDLLFEITSGRWYGWPDFVGGVSVTDPKFLPERGYAPTPLIANVDELPPPEPALLAFPPHAAAVKFDVLPPKVAEWGGQMFVALFGDERPMTAPRGPRVGRSVARVDPEDWSLHGFVGGPLRRPIDVKWHEEEQCLYILDFGQFEMVESGGVDAEPLSGSLWRLPLGHG